MISRAGGSRSSACLRVRAPTVTRFGIVVRQRGARLRSDNSCVSATVDDCSNVENSEAIDGAEIACPDRYHARARRDTFRDRCIGSGLVRDLRCSVRCGKLVAVWSKDGNSRALAW